MKKNHLILLALLVVVLLGVRFLMGQRRGGTATRMSDAGVHLVAPRAIEAATISWIQVTPPPPPAGEAAGTEALAQVAPAPLRWEKREGGWVAVSAGLAPADSEAIEKFLASATALQGETRASGEAARPAFGLGPDQAVRVELGSAADAPLLTFHLGKQGDGTGAHFVSAEGSADILHVRDGLRTPLGLWGAGSAPARDLWLKKDVIAVKAAELARVTFDRPDMRIVMERQVSPEPPAAEGEEAPAPAEPSWAVLEPPLPWPVNAGLEGVVDRVGSLRITSALDASSPACSAEPQASVTLERAVGGEIAVRVRGAVDDSDEVALTLDGQPHCWSLSTWSLSALLPRASAIWEVPALQPQIESEPTRISLARDGRTVTARREGDQWTATGGGIEPAQAANLASAMRFLRLEDIARLPGNLPAGPTITLEAGSERRVLRMHSERPGGGGEWYASFDGAPVPEGHVLVISKGSVKQLLP